MFSSIRFVFLALAFSVFVLGCATTAPQMAETAVEAAPATQVPAEPASVNMLFDEIPFRPFNPKQPNGIHVYAIKGNPQAGPFTAVVRFPAGFMMPLHSHDFAYDGVALSDGLVHGLSDTDIHEVPKGSYWRQPAKEAHTDGCKSDTFCYFLVSFEGPVNLVMEKEALTESKGAMVKPADIPWKELRGGVKMATIRGDHTKGAFLALFSFPAGLTTNVHTHSHRFAGAILSGTHHRGADAENLVTLTPNSVYREAANAPHMEKCGEGSDCIIFASFDGALDTKAVVLTPAEGK